MTPTVLRKLQDASRAPATSPHLPASANDTALLRPLSRPTAGGLA